MNYEMKKWFGNSIMICDIDNAESINKDIKEMVTRDMNPSGRLEIFPDKYVNQKRTEYDGSLDRLFKEIEKGIKLYLKEHNYNLDILDIYITKAWASLTKKGELIAEHNHKAGHYSISYYVEAKDQGNIYFNKEESLGLPIPSSYDCYTEDNQHNIDYISYPSRTGELIIFPSNMIHGTEVNQQENPRISIALDFLLTIKKGHMAKHNLSSPETWKKI